MRMKTGLLLAAMLSTVAAASAFADSAPPPTIDGIQLMPPLSATDPSKVCPPSTTPQVLAWDGKTSLKCIPKLTADADGNLTVGGNAIIAGGASVGESIQVGNTTATCVPARAGSIRWTGTEFEGCNGKAWAALGGGGTPSVPVGGTTTPEVRTVSCDAYYLGTYKNYGCTASCPAGFLATGGSYSAGNISSHAGTVFYLSSNSYYCDINIISCSSGRFPCGMTCSVNCLK